ncbi:hypothetical protein BGX38DRAFT_156038 [Terfezia claveryi]|nr:hypothetical protein BGX38DRAFT_156038 [Terfezia claveryi]
MPYNTRRKSLSLPSLGIQLPNGSRNRERATSTASEQPPQKKFKRIHSVLAIGTATPPPSPPPEGGINHEGINDEIVSGVVNVLEKSRNRPHTVKELAAILAPTLNIVENSANPHAIISSRLNAYLKRGFTLPNRCLVAKELITAHPKKIYFYLTTCPSQPIPDEECFVTPLKRSVISPVSDDEEMRRRVQLSPSPEVDLSSPEFDDDNGPPSPIASVYHNSSIFPRGKTVTGIGRKGTLSHTPMEGDEQEFTRSAIQLKQRSVSREYEEQRRQKRAREQAEERDEEKHEEGRESEDAAALLGYAEAPVADNGALDAGIQSDYHHPRIKKEDEQAAGSGSAAVDGAAVDGTGEIGEQKTSQDTSVTHVDAAHFRSLVGDLQSPESIELDELDDLLGAEFE